MNTSRVPPCAKGGEEFDFARVSMPKLPFLGRIVARMPKPGRCRARRSAFRAERIRPGVDHEFHGVLAGSAALQSRSSFSLLPSMSGSGEPRSQQAYTI